MTGSRQRQNEAATSAGPAATGPARRVYALLRELERNARSGARKQTILGQHCQAQKEAKAGEYWHRVGDLTAAEGGPRRHPGFVEFDFGPGNYRPTYDAPYLEDGLAFARERFLKGEAIVGYCFHMSYPGAPEKSWDNCFPKSGMDDAWFARVVDERGDTPEYRGLLRDLAFAADRLESLQKDGVPVLLRPFHEMNKHRNHNPFWWSARDSAAYRALWGVAHRYLVQPRGLKNLLFVWSPYEWDGTYGTEPFAYYPGDDLVDIVAVDIYHGNPYFPAKFYEDLRRYDKPRAVAECDKMPVRWGDERFPDSVSELDARPWTIWTIWGECLVHAVGTKKPNEWNVSSRYKAVRDTYHYRTGDVWRVLSGGPGRTFDWSRLR